MSKSKNADMPAMPTTTYDHGAAMNGIGVSVTEFSGITKREMFAMAAMQGMCSHSGDYHLHEHLAHDAVMYADALLAALESTK